MQIDVIYDQSSSSLPAGFVSAINDAVAFLDSEFTNPVTITIDVGYGEIGGPDGGSLGPGDLGESNWPVEEPETYSAVRNALIAQDAPGATTLPVNSPFGSDQLYISPPEALALGLPLSGGTLPMKGGTQIDGYVGFATESSLEASGASWDFASGGTVPSDEYYFIGVVEHEITEDMGRVSLLDQPDPNTGQLTDYAVTDLYRYLSAGERDLTEGQPGSLSTAYFSINNGDTNLGTWNNDPDNGDLADWYPEGPAPGGNDAFNDYSNNGVVNIVSPDDIILMEALGWTTGFLVNSANSPYYVSSGVIDSDDIIVSGGSMVVLSGGTAIGTADHSGGFLTLESGGVASGASVAAGGSEIVSAGGTDFAAQIVGGTQDVYGYAGGATVVRGSQVVSAGGTAANTTVSSGGTLTILSGGLADPATLYSGASETIGSGSTDFGARISGGVQEVTGYASGVLVRAGSEVVEAGGSASATTVMAGGSEIVSAAGSVSDIVVSGGTVELSGDAVVSGVAVATSGTLDIGGSGASLLSFMSSLYVSGLGPGDTIDLTDVAFASGATVSASSNGLYISVGGTLYDLTLGTQISHAEFAVISGGADNTEVTISSTSHSVIAGHPYSDSSVDDLDDVVHSGGTMFILSGAIATSTTVDSGGILVLEAGGTEIGLLNSGTVLADGGVISAGSGVIINDGVLDPGGTLPGVGGGGTTTLASSVNSSSLPANLSASDVALLGSYIAAMFAAAEGQLSTDAPRPQLHPDEHVFARTG